MLKSSLKNNDDNTAVKISKNDPNQIHSAKSFQVKKTHSLSHINSLKDLLLSNPPPLTYHPKSDMPQINSSSQVLETFDKSKFKLFKNHLSIISEGPLLKPIAKSILPQQQQQQQSQQPPPTTTSSSLMTLGYSFDNMTGSNNSQHSVRSSYKNNMRSTAASEIKEIMFSDKRTSVPDIMEHNLEGNECDTNDDTENVNSNITLSTKQDSRLMTSSHGTCFNRRTASVSSNIKFPSAKMNLLFSDMKTSIAFKKPPSSSHKFLYTDDNTIDFEQLYKDLELLELNKGSMVCNRQKIAKVIMKHHEYLNQRKEQLSLDEVKLLEDYEKFMLGATDLSKTSVIMSSKNLKNVAHLNRIKDNLLSNKKRSELLSLMKNRKNLKSYLAANKLKDTIEGDTYTYFGDNKNAIFAFNQLRLACELCDNLKLKVKSYLGLAEICKRIGCLDKALRFLKRGLQFIWKIKDDILECELYDNIGIVHYQMGEIEKATFYHEACLNGVIASQNSELVKRSNETIDIFRSLYHSKEDHITQLFFIRLHIPPPPPTANHGIPTTTTTATAAGTIGKINGSEPKGNNTMSKVDNGGSYAVMSESNEPKLKVINQSTEPTEYAFSTFLSIKIQLDAIIGDPDFHYELSSPRCHLVKCEKMCNKREFKLPSHIPGKSSMNNRNKLCEDDKNYFHVKHLIDSGVPIDYKDMKMRLQMRTESNDFYLTFDKLKKNFKSIYSIAPIQSQMIFTHLTPNRNVTKYNNSIHINQLRYKEFYFDAIEHLLKKQIQDYSNQLYQSTRSQEDVKKQPISQS